MTKHIYLKKGDPIGFQETIDSISPHRAMPGYEEQLYSGFDNYDIARFLKRAAEIDGYVILVSETPRHYDITRIYACPDCGEPLRRQGRGVTRKADARYVCARAERWRDLGMDDKKHAFVRAWSVEELEETGAAVQF